MKDLLRFCTSGEVDSGKSMMLGRLLYETGCIYDDQLEAVINSSKKRNKESIDLSLLLDGLESERDQGITIDVAYRYFETKTRRFIVADTPGHEQYTRNMVTGASNSQLAIILIDAQLGVQTQSKRHGIINSLLNIPHLVVAVNKMDLVNYSQEVYNKIVKEYTDFSEKLKIQDITFIPISALNGDNVCTTSLKTPWYTGETVLDKLEKVHISSTKNTVDFRFPVQNVIRPNRTFRGYCGKIISGSIRPGEEVQILPSGLNTRIINIFNFEESKKEAKTGESVVINLSHEIDIDRGDMIVRKGNIPHVKSNFVSMMCWMDETPLQQKPYILKHNTKKVNAYVNVILKIDVNTLHRTDSSSIELNDIFKADIETTKPIMFDEYIKNKENGSFILIDPDTNATVAAGMIEKVSKPKEETKHLSGGVIAEFTGEKGKVLWFTGLSGSGKSTIASKLSKEIQDKGHQVVILDGDNIRKGLCSDLGFSLEDRKENIRRISEVAKLFSDTGITVITSFISPTIEYRKMARNIIGEKFIEVYVECPIEVCEARDVKGLYKKARAGEIKNFTGIGSPYEAPENPDISVNTNKFDIYYCVQCIINKYKDK